MMMMMADDALPVAMAVKKDKPIVSVTHLPHVRKVIDEAPPEYIIMIVVAFLQVFAMTISLVHVINKHRAFTRNKPGMVGPTIGLLTFYWVIATLNLLGLFVLRANLLCQTICSCYDALIGYLFAVLLIAYSNGKMSYLSILRWPGVESSEYSCSSVCCWGAVTQPRVERAVTYVLQLIVIHSATSLAELICENEELFFYPAPLTKSWITFGLKCVQGISLFFALFGFLVLCRAASIVNPRTSPFIKLLLYKSIYIFSAVQSHLLLHFAFNKVLPAVSEGASPVTRAVVWSNFATTVECTLAYFLAVRLYKIEEYTKEPSFKSTNLSKTMKNVENRDAFYRSTFEGDHKIPVDVPPDDMSDDVEAGSASTPELELDKQDLVNLKLLGLKVKLPVEVDETLSLSSLKGGTMNFSSDEDVILRSKKGKLRKGSQTFRSADTMLESALHYDTKAAKIGRGDKSATIGYSKVAMRDSDEEPKPKISIVGGKVNISLSSKDLAMLCKSSTDSEEVRNSIPINLSLEKLTEDEVTTTADDREEVTVTRNPEKARVTFEDNDQKSRNSMQFVKNFNYTQLNCSEDEEEDEESEEDVCELEHTDRTHRTSALADSTSQYVSKISLV